MLNVMILKMMKAIVLVGWTYETKEKTHYEQHDQIIGAISSAFIDIMQTKLFFIPAKVDDFTLLFNSLTGVST